MKLNPYFCRNLNRKGREERKDKTFSESLCALFVFTVSNELCLNSYDFSLVIFRAFGGFFSVKPNMNVG